MSLRTTIDNMPQTSPVDFVGGVFPKRQLSIMASEPGCGKTWVMLEFCASLTNEYIYNKFFGVSFVEKERKCLMMIGDTGREMIIDRINKLDIIKNVKSREYIFYFVSDLIKEKHPFLLNTIEGRGAIQGLIHFEKPDIVFFDTLISFMTADENSAKEIGELFIGLREIAEEENCAIVLNHHFRKTQGGHSSRKNVSLNEVIGSSAMSRLASVMIALVRDKNDIDKKNRVIVSTVKTWYKEIPQFAFEIQDGENGHVRLVPDYAMGNVLKLKRVVKNLGEQLEEGLIISTSDIAQQLKAKEESVQAALKNLALYTPLTNEPDCDKFFITHSKGAN